MEKKKKLEAKGVEKKKRENLRRKSRKKTRAGEKPVCDKWSNKNKANSEAETESMW